MSHTATLTNTAQAADWLQRLTTWAHANLQRGKPVTIVAKEQKRTLPQNSKLHPTIGEIARKLGRKTDTESLRVLRYLLLEQWRFETGRAPAFERSMDGLRWVSVNAGTSDLDKPDCSEFIEWLIAQEAGL
jgi:hypothetical protein